MEQITFENWLASLDEQDKAALEPIWYAHVANFAAEPTDTPQSDEFKAMWTRYMADTTI